MTLKSRNFWLTECELLQHNERPLKLQRYSSLITEQSAESFAGSNVQSLSLNNVAKGIYMLNVNITQGTSKVKIVVE